MNKYLGCSVCIAALLLAGCTRRIDSNVYSENHVGEASFSYQGTILNVRKVRVGSEQLQENVEGGALGAVGGGLLGSAFGKGDGKTAMTAIGAIGGAIGGAMAQQALREQEAVEYTIKLTNGQVMTVVQGLEDLLPKGSAVIVIVGQAGRSRVIRDTSEAKQGVQAPLPTPRTVTYKRV
ncbi:MAG: glycine zipper 2TM domain-containing protein [Holosporales bacterium]|nr:glycine zipper 2TM domain-containing protein [Holosporales bacterium]